MTRIQKPILDSGLYESIEATLTQFAHRGIWKSWGMNSVREQGAAILFYGPPGTGKTTTAKWIAKYLGRDLRQVDFSDIGSDKPGQLARNIKFHFMSAIAKDDETASNANVIFLDECDTVLVDRKRVGYNMLWMLEVINQLLTCIRQFKGLCILATNAEPEFLDSALDSRLLAKFKFENPKEELTRINLWKSKWPTRLPTQPNDKFFEIAAKYSYNGSEIEQFLLSWVGDAIRTAGNNAPEENLHISKLIEMLIAPTETFAQYGEERNAMAVQNIS
jgi:SpoVK/Ycf46/Vps4 family AAA+-type ATPase